MALCMTTLLTACGPNGSGPFVELAGLYALMQENDTKMAEAFQAVYKAPKDEQPKLQQQAQEIAEKVKADNAELADLAKQLGGTLQGTEIPCEATEATGIKVESAVLETVQARDRMANIVMRINHTGTYNGKPYCQFLKADGTVACETPAMLSEKGLSVNFRLLPKNAKEYIEVVKIKFVTEAEYKGVKVAGPAAETAPAAEQTEPEPAYTGEGGGENAVDKATVAGVNVAKGDNLVAVLKAHKNVTYEYNADSGIWASIGSVALVISEDDLNEKGVAVISKLTSDIEPNVPLTPDCFKPSAKVTTIEKQ